MQVPILPATHSPSAASQILQGRRHTWKSNHDKQWQSWNSSLIFLVKCVERTLISMSVAFWLVNALEMEREGVAGPLEFAKWMLLFRRASVRLLKYRTLLIVGVTICS